MPKLTLNDLASLANQTAAINTINNNNQLIEDAIENTLSRDGTTPNTMEADIDMDSNRLLNVGSIDSARYLIGGQDASLFGQVVLKGAWTTATNYEAFDLVTENNDTYICLVDHLSGDFDTDYITNTYWAPVGLSLNEFYERYIGESATEPTQTPVGNALSNGALYWNSVTETFWVYNGAVWQEAVISEALEPANNLSDVASVTTSRQNLGLEIGVDVQAQDPALQQLSDITFEQGDIIYHNGSSLVELPPGTNGQLLQTQGVGANPLWADAPGANFTVVEPVTVTGTSEALFTGVPSGTEEIYIYLHTVSSVSDQQMIIQIGDSGGIETSGYIGRSSSASNVNFGSTNGFPVYVNDRFKAKTGVLKLVRSSGLTNTWYFSGITVFDNISNTVIISGGNKSLSEELTQVRVAWFSNINFDGGTVGIAYRGA